MTTQIALLRGINVGRAKRVAMADLREALAGLGYTNVRTLLNSGNAVFEAPGDLDASAPVAIREAVAARTGVTAAVMVVSAIDLDAIVAENPLAPVEANPSHCLVAFPAMPDDLARAAPLLEADWAPDRFALGPRAAYLWCVGGILESTLVEQFGRLTGASVTTRNWATVLKLLALSRPTKSS